MNELFSQYAYQFTYPFTLDHKISVYIDKSCQPVAFIKDLISQTDALLDNIKFKYTKKKNAEIRFYEKDLLQNNNSYLGLAVPKGNHWDLLIRRDANALKQWVYVHEFGHSLGMEHPFDGSDGDYWISTKPWESVTTNETVMSYRYVSSDNWFFRTADIDTITGIWNN